MNYYEIGSFWIRATKSCRSSSFESEAFIILISRVMSARIRRCLSVVSGRANMSSISLKVMLVLSFVVCECVHALGGGPYGRQ
jgi:hypothetical protein